MGEKRVVALAGVYLSEEGILGGMKVGATSEYVYSLLLTDCALETTKRQRRKI
jgi:hypothetical protein